MTGIADMAHHHANGTIRDVWVTSRREQADASSMAENRPCHCTVPRPASADGGGKHVSAVKRAGGLPARTVNVQHTPRTWLSAIAC